MALKVQRVKKDVLYKDIAERLNLYQEDIASILECTVAAINDYLIFASEEKGINVELVDGVWFTSRITPAGIQRIRDVEPFIAPDRLTYGVKFSDKYISKQDEDYHRMQMISQAAKRYRESMDKKE